FAARRSARRIHADRPGLRRAHGHRRRHRRSARRRSHRFRARGRICAGRLVARCRRSCQSTGGMTRVVALFIPAAVAATFLWWASSPVLNAAGQSSESMAPLDSAAILREAAQLPRLHSILVSRSGTTIFERYFNGAGPARPANIKSASKSIISALVGIAIDRKLIADVRQPIGPFFDTVLTGDAANEKRRITIENLLTMQSGLQSTSNRNYGAWVQSPNCGRYALLRPLESLPGTRMAYSTGNTHLLSAILTNATGTSTWQFAQDAIARPLGFSLPRWPQDPQGIYFGGNDMLLTPRQMLAFGELYLRHGRISAKESGPVTEVVPRKWIEQSFVPRGVSPI